MYTSSTTAFTIDSNQCLYGNGTGLTHIQYTNIDGKPTNFQSDYNSTVINTPNLSVYATNTNLNSLSTSSTLSINNINATSKTILGNLNSLSTSSILSINNINATSTTLLGLVNGHTTDSTQAVPMLPRATVAQSSSEELHSTSPVYPSWDGN